MNVLQIKNKSGLSLTVTDDYNDDCDVISGGMQSNPSWEEYLSKYKPIVHPHFELIKEAIHELNWVGKTGEQTENYYFVFSDGIVFTFSWRGWGDLMQSIVGLREGYMKYYM
jgi:hypothetical protein